MKKILSVKLSFFLYKIHEHTSSRFLAKINNPAIIKVKLLRFNKIIHQIMVVNIVSMLL